MLTVSILNKYTSSISIPPGVPRSGRRGRWRWRGGSRSLACNEHITTHTYIHTYIYYIYYIYIYIYIYVCIYIYIYTSISLSIHIGRADIPFHSIRHTTTWWRWRRARRSICQSLSPERIVCTGMFSHLSHPGQKKQWADIVDIDIKSYYIILYHIIV